MGKQINQKRLKRLLSERIKLQKLYNIEYHFKEQQHHMTWLLKLEKVENQFKKLEKEIDAEIGHLVKYALENGLEIERTSRLKKWWNVSLRK